MARYLVKDYQAYTTTAYTLAAGDSLYVTSAGTMDAQNASLAVLISATSATVQNDGTITSNYDCVYLYGGTLLNNGHIYSTTADSYTVWVRVLNSTTAASSVYNTGLIANYSGNASAHAIVVSSPAAIVNDGTIASYVAGTAISSGSMMTLVNNGEITGPRGGTAILTTSGTSAIDNHGHITGAITLSSGADTITNDGTISGTVTLGGGNDVLDNTHGTITGNIIGGAGDDIITGGDGRDVIYGDNVSGDTSGGVDQIYGGYGDDLINGGYGNDFLYGNQGDDILYGNQNDDYMHGGQGDDQLFGGQGNDLLIGGVGNDMLTGGVNNDQFIFSRGFGHDTITDFGTAADNFDYLTFQAGTFASYADVQSHMVQQGANVLITLDPGDTILVLNTNVAAITPDHVLFA